MRLSWLSQITARYAIFLVAPILLPVMIVVVAYDRCASALLDILTGTQLKRRIAIMHSRLAGFIEVRLRSSLAPIESCSTTKGGKNDVNDP